MKVRVLSEIVEIFESQIIEWIFKIQDKIK